MPQSDMQTASQPAEPRPPRSGPQPRSGLSFNLLLTLPFILLFLVQLRHHNMWRDELNAFGIAVASPTLSSLFAHIHYEGHPTLWYLLLWAVSKFTVFPVGMKILEACIGIAIYLCIGLLSPFSPIEKILIFASYFISFEYTVLSRMYSVVLLLLVLYLWQRTAHPRAILWAALTLGLIANTDLLGIMLTFGLLAEFLLSDTLRQLWAEPRGKARLASFGALYVLLLAVAAVTMRTSHDISWRTTHRPFQNLTAGNLKNAILSSFVMPYFPVSYHLHGHFWNPQAWQDQILHLLFLPIVLALYLLLFRRNRNLLALVAVTSLFSVAFGFLIYTGSMRHFGLTFLAFLAALWILRPSMVRLPSAAYLLLALSAIGGVAAAFDQWSRPFSNAQPAAVWLHANELDRRPLVGTPDTSVAAVAELLHASIYQLDCNCSDTFLLFSKRRDAMLSDAEVPARLALAMQTLQASDAIYLRVRPIDPAEDAEMVTRGLNANLLSKFTGAENDDEDFYIYRVSTVQTTAHAELHTGPI